MRPTQFLQQSLARRAGFRASVLALAIPLTSLFSGQGIAAEIEKSPNDPREYRALELENGLKVTLIHDATTDSAAASMDVAIGSGSDPEGRAGLAHFLEHMLFLGTEKYPDADQYSRFIREHGGSNNAYTSFSNTNYFFSVESAYLEPALDLFAQFFIAPLFTEDLVQREKNAVHSEFTGKVREDSRRFWSARRRGFNQDHPMSGFSTGNLDTLADREGSNIRDELISFYNRFYSSNIMSVAIIGREPLDQLEKWAREKFSAVPNRNASKQKFDRPLYAKDELPWRMNIKPLKDQRYLTLTFPTPKREEHRFTRPKSYLGNILGHEGEGSLLSALKRSGWVDSLSAGGGINNRGATTFDMSIGLTEPGVDHVDDIVTEVFRAINMVRESGLPKWLYDETRQLNELSFKYQEQSEPSNLVRTLAVRAQDWPAQKLLSGPYRRSKFDVEGIQEILDHLRPDNLALMLVAPDVKTDKQTQYYDADYSVTPIPAATVKRWQDAGLSKAITMPTPNEFVPRDVALKPDGSGDPVRIVDSPKLEVWHRTDTEFGVPRANLNINIHTPVANESARSLVLTILYVRMLNEQLNEFSYPAALAGLSYDFFQNRRGLGIRLSGYSDGQRQMLEKVVDAMINPTYNAKVFERLRKELIDQISNISKDAPYEQTSNEIRRLLLVPYYDGEARKKELRNLTIADLKAFVPRLYKDVRVVALSHGNVDEAETRKRVAVLEDAIISKAGVANVPRSLVVRLPEDSRFARKLKIKHNDSAVSVYVQGEERHRASRARFAMLRQMLSQPFYADLRTRQQLGYFVFTYSMDLMRVPSVILALQSPGAGPGTLSIAVEKFLKDFEKTLIDMPEAEFERHRRALIARVEEQEKRLSERTGLYWSTIVREEYIFDGPERFADELRDITRADIVALYRKLFIDASAGRLVVYSEGKIAKDESPEFFESMSLVKSRSGFKKDKTLHPPLNEIDGFE